jgi:hypothetical protein
VWPGNNKLSYYDNGPFRTRILYRMSYVVMEMLNKFLFVTEWREEGVLLFVLYSVFPICATVIKSQMCFHTFLTLILRQTNYTDCGQSKISGHTFLQCFIIRMQVIVKIKPNIIGRIYI